MQIKSWHKKLLFPFMIAAFGWIGFLSTMLFIFVPFMAIGTGAFVGLAGYYIFDGPEGDAITKWFNSDGWK